MTKTSAETAKFEELKSYIDEVKSVPGPLMPIMQKAQDIFGYLPIEVQDFIAEELGDTDGRCVWCGYFLRTIRN